MGHTVVGVEFVENAIEQFFQGQNIKFTVEQIDEFKCFKVNMIKYLNSQLVARLFPLSRFKESMLPLHENSLFLK